MSTITKTPAEETYRPLPEQIEETIRSLRTLLDDDEHEQRETFEHLKKSLDEDRPSNRKLFPST